MKSKTMIKIILVILIVFPLAFLGYIFLKNKNDERVEFLKEVEFKQTGVRFVPEGWKEYRNELHGFSLLYEGELVIKQFDEGGGASTITFEDSTGQMGFQIFVVPYGEEKITQERFLKDSPLGVRESPSDTNVDGVVATSFYGRNVEIGDTWEIWFVRNGLLYEASAPKNLEEWASSIIKTWRFL